MTDLLLDLADACRLSGLTVVELDGWERNYSNGAFRPDGSLDHHTGSYDALADAKDDLAYAKWLAFTGRPDLPPPLANLALSAECVVYVLAAGNANHAGRARATGPMPAAGDGSSLYVGTECMNSGKQGWGSVGRMANGAPITQGEALAALDGALALHYKWPAEHVRAHRETSVTGKWDPGLLNMIEHRAAVAAWVTSHEGLNMDENRLRQIIAEEVAKVVDVKVPDPEDTTKAWSFSRLLWNAQGRLAAIEKRLG